MASIWINIRNFTRRKIIYRIPSLAHTGGHEVVPKGHEVKNELGDMIFDFSMFYDLMIVNTFHKKMIYTFEIV